MPRDELIESYARRTPAITVLVAPAGFGKSTVVRQLCESCQGARVIWLDMGGQSLEPDELPAVVARLLVPEPVEGDGVLGHPMPAAAPAAIPVLVGRLRDALAGEEHAVVVLDDLDLSCGLAGLSTLYAAMVEVAGATSRLLVTSRALGQAGIASGPDETWLIDADDLRLSSQEAHRLVCELGGPRIQDDDVQLALEISEHQVGLFAMIVHHPRVLKALRSTDSGYRLPLGLVKSFEQLAISSLGDEERRALLYATLLGSGKLADLGRVAADVSVSRTLRRVSEAMPLVRISVDPVGSAVFDVHELALSAFASPEALQLRSTAFEEVLQKCYRELRRRGDLGRLFSLLLERGEASALTDYLESSGHELLQMGLTRTLRAALDAVPVERRLERPQLLLVRAALLRQTEQYEEAIHEAAAAHRLAEAERDPQSLIQSSILLARLYIDTSDYRALIGVLEPVKRLAPSLSPDDECLLNAYLAVGHGQLGDLESSKSHITIVSVLLAKQRISSAVRAHAANCCAFVTAYLLGDFNKASALVEEIPSLQGLPKLWLLQAKGNLGTLQVETGRVAASLRLLDETIAECRDIGAAMLAIGYESSRAIALAGLGDIGDAEAAMRTAIDAAEDFGDEYAIGYAKLYRASVRRASGRVDEALEDAESVSMGMRRLGLPSQSLLADLEAAACRCSMRDYGAASAAMPKLRKAAAELGSAYHLLRADMILAEIERERGDYRAAVKRMSAQAEYILTESSNWQIAMYLRAFPGLLGVMGEAVGPERMPAHLLRMVLPDYARLGLDMARTILDPEGLKALAVRMLGTEDAEQYLRGGERPNRLKVGFFGGLTVEAPGGPILDSAWRKRKSRLLFAMLVARRGEDVPKDVLFERLWPDMDEDRAKSNFYVIWSAMRRVLCSGTTEDDCPYVEHRAGVCRAVSEQITLDLDEFDAVAAELRTAEKTGHVQDAIEAAEQLCLIYHGEVLPGDVYDDWFAPLRERYRDEFGDLMVKAAEVAAEGAQTEVSLRFIRAALAQNLWREDLYQAALRYQISSGQRSSAVETYMACRSKLQDDLGLDPSAETQALYEQVLAMDPAPARKARY